jgi:predicted RNase H-like HicB family nuclease
VALIPYEDSNGFTTFVYDIAGAIAQGDTREEAKYEVLLALEDILEDNYFEQERPVPLSTSIEDITIEDIESHFDTVRLNGCAKEYLDYIELSEELSRKILEHNKKLCLYVA